MDLPEIICETIDEFFAALTLTVGFHGPEKGIVDLNKADNHRIIFPDRIVGIPFRTLFKALGRTEDEIVTEYSIRLDRAIQAGIALKVFRGATAFYAIGEIVHKLKQKAHRLEADNERLRKERDEAFSKLKAQPSHPPLSRSDP